MSNKINNIFIIGAARSGTKFVRDVIGEAESVSVIPFDINHIWKQGINVIHDELRPEFLSDSKSKTIKRLIGDLECNNGEVFLIEKTVSNSLRLDWVDAIYPSAKYIVLVRDGKDVVESSYRVWKKGVSLVYLYKKFKYFSLLKDWRHIYKYFFKLCLNFAFKNKEESTPLPWGPVYKGMMQDLKEIPLYLVAAKQWKFSIKRTLESVKKIDKDRVLFIRYEDVVASDVWIQEIFTFINLKDEALPPKRRYHKLVKTGQKNLWESAFSSEQKKEIIKIIKPEMEKLKYIDY
jgi:hypothetical protein